MLNVLRNHKLWLYESVKILDLQCLVSEKIMVAKNLNIECLNIHQISIPKITYKAKRDTYSRNKKLLICIASTQ
jgi:hypothetical protein